MNLTVVSVDRAGNSSPSTTYDIQTKASYPTISTRGQLASFGNPTAFALNLNAALEKQSSVKSYNVVVVGGAAGQQNFTVNPAPKVSSNVYGTTQTTVPAHDGKAKISWRPTAAGSYDIEVSAILPDGTQLFPYDFFTVG